MNARIPFRNDLQRVFATRAHADWRGYILPWTRGFFTTSSSLDPIYEELGNPNLDYNTIRALILGLPIDKKHKYRSTLRWLIQEVLQGDYIQQGNSCGAWSLTHWQMREARNYYGAAYFRGRALANYHIVKFDIGDVGVGPQPALLNVWADALHLVPGGPYANPWKIIQQAPGSAVQIEPNARIFAQARADALAQCLDDMRQAVEDLRPAALPAVANGNLSTLPIGSCAIIIAYDPPPIPVHGIDVMPLHYMLLVHVPVGWWLFNSNSHKLNPTVLHACPGFNAAGAGIATDLKGNHWNPSGTETWHFTGVFIKR